MENAYVHNRDVDTNNATLRDLRVASGKELDEVVAAISIPLLNVKDWIKRLPGEGDDSFRSYAERIFTRAMGSEYQPLLDAIAEAEKP